MCANAAASARRMRSRCRVAGEQYDRIIDHELGSPPSIPPRLDGSDERDDGNLPVYVYADDEVPF